MTTAYHNQQQLLRDRRICAVIPTYNNAATIATVVSQVQQQCLDVIVVDDGSTDATPAILGTICGIQVVRHARNRGKGYALRTAFREALRRGFAYAITIDADGQHYAADISRFLDANRRHPGSLIVGARRLQGVVRSKGSILANRISNFWFAVHTGRRLPDTQSGYRLYPLKKLRGLSLLPARYEAETALLVFSAWHGTPIHSIPIDVYYPPLSERVSHFRPAADFMRISVLNTILCLLAVVYGLPLRLFRWLAPYVRTLYALCIYIVGTLLVVTPLAWLMVKCGAGSQRLRRLIWHTARFVMLKHGIPGTTFSSRVAEGVSFDKPHIIICNHQSHLDLLCQLIFTPKMVFLTNEWVWHTPFYGFLIRHAEYQPIADGLEALLPRLRRLVERGYSIALYPEGTRSHDGQIGRFHQGAFYLAQQLGIDVLPMHLWGTGRVLPKGKHRLNSGPIAIEVGTSFSPVQLQTLGNCRRQASWMRSHYVKVYQDMTNKMEQDV